MRGIHSGNSEVIADGAPVLGQVTATLEQIEQFSKEVLSGKWKGFTGKTITDVVNVGIGGSDLGPQMVVDLFVLKQ